MQSAAASQQQGLQGGVPPCRSSSSSSPENSSSSSPAAASLPTSRPGFESMQQQNHHHQQQNHHNQHQQQQQQQQQNFRQQQQLLRKSQGDEGLLTYQAGNLQGIVVGSGVSGPVGPTQMSQQARNFMDLAQQQQVASQLQGEGQAKNQNQMNAHAYLQFALQAAQHKARANIQSQQQGKAAAIGSTVVDQELLNNLKHQELMRLQAANQAQMSMFKKSPGQFMQMDKHMEQGQTSNDVRNETKTQPVQVAQLPGNVVRPGHGLQNQHPMQSLSNNQYANLAQLQALQAWAMDKNIDISSPANAHLIPQLLIQWQARIAALQKANDGNLAAHQARLLPGKSDITSSSVQGYAPPSNPSTSHSNSMPEVHAVQGGLQLHQKPRQAVATGSASAVGSPAMANPNVTQLQHSMPQGGDYQVDRVNRHQNPATSTMASIHGLSSSPSVGQVGDSSVPKNAHVSPESLQMQYYRQLHQFHRPPMHPAGLNEGSTSTHLSNPPVNHPAPVQQQYGFTKHQLIVLRAQILAFRRLKRGESTLPPDVIRAIVPPPLQPQQCQTVAVPKEKIFNQNAADQPRAVDPSDAQRFVAPNKGPNMLKEERDMKESIMSEERKPTSNAFPGIVVSGKEVSPIVVSEKEEKINKTPVKMEQEAEQVTQVNTPTTSELPVDRSKTIVSKPPQDVSSQVKKHPGGNTAQVPKDMNISKKYHGPLFDFPPFGKKLNAFLPTNLNGSNGGYSLSIGYDVKDLLFEEGKDVLNKKRTENLKKIERLLAVKLDRKRIRPDLVVKLQIEERKLRLLDLQARIRDELDQEQQEIMAMPDRPYRKFVRLCERQRADLARQVQLSQKAIKEKHLKAVFQWRKRLFEAHWAIRDARTTRNRGVAKYHEKMLKEFSKRKDEDRNKRMEALKNNDVDRYRQMLLEQQSQIPGDAQERYLVLSSFLSQTEEYLQKLGGKITAAKAHQEVEEAAIAAAAAARAQGLSEEEVKAAAACAGQEVKTRNRFSEMNASRNNMSINKYYNLAHAVNEKIVRQPSMLRAGTLRDYQLVGLQWMLSLYNNKLNGILADEMGLGKTVQVMALIAYLMEYKGNYGPHLIIVPNAVMVNWKSELHNWLPTLSCIYYVGSKDQRVRLYSKEVCAMKFNVLVTTYEFIMRDRAKLSRVDWKYIIIDEAQRMKDRESQLSRDLDRFRCQRRLLLTGTPLQNDLQELWSLLNLLLPEVFDNRKAFHDWFSKPFQKDAPSQSSEDDWLETEKKVIIIHRLHQILEPFMLRRRVEDVEGSLPPKISVVLRCKMSALQGAIYDWIKATGSLRLDPQTEARRVESNPKRQIRAYVPLQNRCMELRKVCNHPLLSYPYRQDYSNDYMVRSCGKLWVLDRILIKLHRTGHRVLLFSTMTKLLDILEEYLQWRRLQYRRIDGTTSLEDRESAIGDFNKPGSECFLFLLSIRAAGRGLNLQSADTVVIYDPDPNPKNEEQAVARAHRIGQKREVKVIYMEAVVETITSYQKEDELRTGGTVDDEDELAGKDRYMGSVESLVRNNIQQYKIDMADEVINAGRFDQRTTQEERRVTLETLLHDEERYQETVHDVPSMQEVNRLIARSKEEVELFDQMDEELNWPGEMMRHHQIPKWLRVGSLEVNAAVTSMSKQAMKRGLVVPIGTKEEEDRLCAMHPIPAPEKKLGNMKTNSNKRLPRSESNSKKQLPHKHRDIAAVNNEGEDSEDSLEEKDGSSTHEEEGEIREDLEDEENSRAAGPEPNDGVQSEEETEIECDEGDNELSKAMDVAEKIVREGIEREAASSESSFQNGKLNTCQASSPTISAQKFGSLAALEAKPLAHPKTMVEELEEGEIVASGDSHMDFQHSGSWVHEREDGEEEQVLQPKIKRKRSMRNRPRPNSDKLEEKPNVEKRVLHPGNFYQQSSNQASYDYGRQLGLNKEVGAFSESVYDKSEHWGANLKRKQLVQARVDDGLPETIAVSKQHVLPKHNRVNGFVEPNQDATEYPRERRDSKLIHSGGSPNCIGGGHMAETYQKRCKIVLDKLQAAINKSGGLITVLFSELPKRNENPGYYRCTVNPIDARTIEQRLDRCEYASVLDFATDVQMVLDNAGRYSSEVKPDARRYQAIFFQRMALAFPDVDFSFVKTRSLVSLGQSSTPSTSSPKQQLNPSRLLKSQDGLSLASDSGSGKYLAPRNSSAVSEEMREKATLKENISKMPKETRVMFADRAQDRERGKGDEVDEVTHPGDFVICKKKRKDRDKVVVKPRMVNQAADITQAVRGLPQKDILLPGHARQAQGWPQFVSTEKNGTSGLDTEDVQWAKPVKRLRTDTGKRRPSHI